MFDCSLDCFVLYWLIFGSIVVKEFDEIDLEFFRVFKDVYYVGICIGCGLKVDLF